MALVVNKDNSFLLSFMDFSGGLNTRDLDTIIADNELSDVANFTFDKRGALKIRPGFAKYSSAQAGTDIVKSVGAYYKVSATAEVIATAGTSIYKFASSASTVIKTGLTGDSLIFDLHQYFNHYFMGNGIDDIQVYDGSSVWDIGYTKPSTAPSAADAGSGSMASGTYKYKVTFYYADGESNPCDSYANVTIAASHNVSLTSIPTGGARVVSRKIYRTVADGATYKLLTTITDNVTTSMTDSSVDSALGADMDSDNDEPPICKYILNHKGRLWLAGDPNHPSRLYYSKTLHPEAFPPSYYWDVGEDDGTIITGLAFNLGMMVIFKNYSTWLISGDTPVGNSADMVLTKANPRVGCVSFKTMAHAGNDLLFLSPNLGVQRLHRVILAATETMDVDALSDKIDTTVDGLNESYLQYACAEIYDHKYHLFVPEGDTVTQNNIALVLDLREFTPSEERTVCWTRYTNMNFASCCLLYDTSGDRLLCGNNSANGYIYDYGTATNDDGIQIEAYGVTKNHGINSFMNAKTLRSFAVFGRASEDWNFTIRIFCNQRGTTSQSTYIFTAGTFVQGEDVEWDTFLFDKFMWDSNPGYTNVVVDFMKPHLLTQSRVNLVKFKIEDVSANQEFALYGLQLKGNIGNAYIYE